jgi:hypothetical protein
MTLSLSLHVLSFERMDILATSWETDDYDHLRELSQNITLCFIFTYVVRRFLRVQNKGQHSVQVEEK